MCVNGEKYVICFCLREVRETDCMREKEHLKGGRRRRIQSDATATIVTIRTSKAEAVQAM